tara:strand:- start:732 stop:974 length:243 start_codon:yes stop_codon:yes gene_type:complete
MDKSYIKSAQKEGKIGEWVLFFTMLAIFAWLVFELFNSFDSQPNYRWESSFNIVGLSMGLIFVFFLLFFLSKSLFKKTFL